MSRGFSTLEILLALTIMSTVLSAVVIVELEGPASLANGSQELTAVSAASALLDTSLHEGFFDFADLHSLASTTSRGVTTSLQVTLLPDGFTKSLTSDASWTDGVGTSRFISLDAVITDFLHAPQNPCSDVLSGDWTHPQEFAFSVAPGGLLPSGFSALHPVSTLAIGSSTLIGGVGTTSMKTDPSLFIFDISSTTHPAYLGSIDNASSTVRGVNDIAISGNYLFVANASQPNFATCKSGPSCAQLQVFDSTNLTAPLNIANLELATTSAPFATGSDGQSIGKSIAYTNGYVYLGLSKAGSSNGEEFNIIDVRNPQTPVWVGGFTIGRTINHIIVRGSYAYLATDDPTREFIMLDVHDPKNITLVGSYDAPGASTFGYGDAVSTESTVVGLGRTYTPNGPELSILSIASTAPQLLSTEQIASPSNPVNVEAVLIRNFLLFVLTSASLQLFDIHDPAHPSPYGSQLSLPNSSTASAMACIDNTLYVSSIGADQTGYLTIFTGS